MDYLGKRMESLLFNEYWDSVFGELHAQENMNGFTYFAANHWVYRMLTKECVFKPELIVCDGWDKSKDIHSLFEVSKSWVPVTNSNLAKLKSDIYFNIFTDKDNNQYLIREDHYKKLLLKEYDHYKANDSFFAAFREPGSEYPDIIVSLVKLKD